MTTHETIILSLHEELEKEYPNHTFRLCRKNYTGPYNSIDIHSKKGGRQTIITTLDTGIQIVVNFDKRPILDYNDPQLFERLTSILSLIL